MFYLEDVMIQWYHVVVDTGIVSWTKQEEDLDYSF